MQIFGGTGTETEAEAEPEASGSSRAEHVPMSRWDLHPIDVLVPLLAIGIALWWFRITADSWFVFDEWRLAVRGHTPIDFIRPYNSHLSITYIGLYRLHFGLFGIDQYFLLRAIGTGALASVPIALYFITRRLVLPVVAGFCAVLVLMTTSPGLEPGGMNHNISLTFGLIAAWAMTREGRRFDLLVGAALSLSIATAGDALPFALALVVLCAGHRVSVRRWLAVAVPTGLWVVWRITLGSSEVLLERARVSLLDKLLVAPRSLPDTMRGLTFGYSPAALLLSLALVAGLVYKVRTQRWVGVVSIVAWLGAWGGWWFGLADARGILTDTRTFRYRLAASVFLTLAVLPSGMAGRLGGSDGPDNTPQPVRPRKASPHQWLGASLVALVFVGLLFANLDATRDQGKIMAAYAREAHPEFIVATSDPTVVPTTYEHTWLLGLLTQEELLDVVRGYGPTPLTPEQADARLVEMGLFHISLVSPAPADDTCSPTSQRINTTGAPVLIRTTDRPANVGVRLIGDDDVPLVEVPPNSTITVVPPRGEFDKVWVMTTGPACV